MSWFDDLASAYSQGGPSTGIFAVPETVGTDFTVDNTSYVPPTAIQVNDVTEGVSFGGVLKGVEATANSLLNFGTKIYSLQNSVENAKFAQQVKSAQLDLSKAQISGDLAVRQAQTDAQTKIALAQAQRATNDALTRVNSSASKPSGMSPLLMVALGFGLYKALK